jgi:GDP-L-fucose synthase
MKKDAKIFVAGGTGLVGSALLRKLLSRGFENIVVSCNTRIPKDQYSAGSKFVKMDLTRQAETEAFFDQEKPEYVFLSAAKVGGIQANNTYKANFIYDNIMISSNVIHASYISGVKKLLNFGSSCIYPKFAPQPLREEYLLTGELEPTNEPYAIAKIAAVKLCRYFNEQYGSNFISVMPTNLYGPNDNYDLENSHVLPALLRKFHEAKVNKIDSVTIWGSGEPLREFLHSDDLADASIYIMENFNAQEVGEFINIGVGKDIRIRELAQLIKEVVDYQGKLVFDKRKPDGTQRKLLDISRLTDLGWQASISLKEGITDTYSEFKNLQPTFSSSK